MGMISSRSERYAAQTHAPAPLRKITPTIAATIAVQNRLGLVRRSCLIPLLAFLSLVVTQNRASPRLIEFQDLMRPTSMGEDFLECFNLYAMWIDGQRVQPWSSGRHPLSVEEGPTCYVCYTALARRLVAPSRVQGFAFGLRP
jgi:hypothetical protein